MSNSKRCIVFSVDKTNEDGRGDRVELYVLDDMFTRIKDIEKDRRLESYSRVMKLRDSSSIAAPFKTIDHRHLFAGYTSFGSRVYRAGGNYRKCLYCEVRFNASRNFTKSVDCWDALTGGSWSLPEMNAAREDPRLIVLRGTLFAIGGYRSKDHKDFPFVEYFVEEKNAWFATENPPREWGLDLNYFVCGAIEEDEDGGGRILIGSKSGMFVVLKPIYNSSSSGKEEVCSCIWSSSWIEYNKEMLDDCTNSPPAVVDGTKLIWLDEIGTSLVVLDYELGKYFSVDLADQGVLPTPRCHHYFPKLVSLCRGSLALIWRDKSLYVLGGKDDVGNEGEEEEEEINEDEEVGNETEILQRGFGGFQCTSFTLVQHTDEILVTITSRKKCIGPSPYYYLTAAFVVDVHFPPCSVKRSSDIAYNITSKIMRSHSKGHACDIGSAMRNWWKGSDDSSMHCGIGSSTRIRWKGPDDSSMRCGIGSSTRIQFKKKEEEKDDLTNHPDPHVAQSNRLRAMLGLKPMV